MDDNFYYNQGYYTDIDYVVKADELQGVYFQGQGMLNKWYENISNIENQLLTIIDTNSFEGATANNIKSYLFEAHLAYTIPYLNVLFYLFTVQYGSYIYGYSQIDSDIHMSVNTKTLDQACTDYRVDFIGENYDLIKKSLEDVSDLYTCSIPDIETINIVHEMMYKIPKELSESIVNYETNIMNTDVQSFNELILNILNMVNNLKERNNEFVLSYVENNITLIPGVNETGQLAKNVIQELDEKQAEIQLHQEYEAGVIKQLQKEEEERIEEAKKRAKKGKKNAIIKYVKGAVVVTISAVAIVATDGAATPFVIAGATSLLSMTSAVSDYNEYDEIGEAAKNGVALTRGHNFMRDKIFGGNENLYRSTMFANDIISTCALMANGVVNLAYNSTGICDFLCQAGVDYGTPILACKATDSGIDLAAEKFGINDYLKEGLKFSVDSYMTYKISNIGKAGNKKPKVVESIEGDAIEGGNKTLLTGEEWNNYFKEEYGPENVTWESGPTINEGGSGSVKSGINQIEPYSGVKQASQFLKEQGFSRDQRVEYLQSFDVRTIYMDVADVDTYGFRFHDFGKNAYPKGRYLYETFSNLSTREGAAIKQSWNEMTGIKQWKISEVTIIIKGKAASQIENGYKFQGGVEQWFISNTK